MDPTQITVAALAFAGSCIVQKCADASLEAAWARIALAYRSRWGSEPDPHSVVEISEVSEPDGRVLSEAELVFGLSSSLRRARAVSSALQGAKILWIDDRPENNAWERSLLRAFGAHSITRETTRSALAALASDRFDVVVSDIARENDAREGLHALPEIVAAMRTRRVVFYVGHLSSSVVPPGALGITNDPNELLHLVLDALERDRL